MNVSSPAQAATPSEAVTETVAACEGIDSTELDVPLYKAIEPEALNTLVQGTEAERDHSPLEVRFSYYGYEVTVTPDGSVHLTEDG